MERFECLAQSKPEGARALAMIEDMPQWVGEPIVVSKGRLWSPRAEGSPGPTGPISYGLKNPIGSWSKTPFCKGVQINKWSKTPSVW